MMDWIKIPTDNILYSEFKDSELVALIKYQALYCQLEKEPSNEQIKRILNQKQREFVKSNAEVVQELCKSQVQIVKTKRNKDKESYKQKQTLIENSDVGKLSERKLVHGAEKIREDKRREDIPPISPKEGDEADSLKIELPNNFFELFLDVWNNNLSNEIKAPKIKVLSDERKKKIKSIINFISKENKTIDYKEILNFYFSIISKKCKDSSFLRGEKNSFCIDIDFVLRKDKFIKIMEGSYDDK